jgi:hypothetical protein
MTFDSWNSSKEDDMPANDVREENLQGELNALGENLQRAIRNVWQSDERKQLQADVEGGLEAALRHLRGELKEFQDSATGERLKADLQSVENDLRSGETATMMRQEILRVLQRLNAELEQATRPAAGGHGPSDKEPGG